MADKRIIIKLNYVRLRQHCSTDQRLQLDFLEEHTKCVESFLELQEIHVEVFIPTLKPENQPEFFLLQR